MYIISLRDDRECRCFLFSGSKSDLEFKKLTIELIPEAARMAVLHEQSEKYPTYVGFHNIIMKLIDLLKDKYYELESNILLKNNDITDDVTNIMESLGDADTIVSSYNDLLDREYENDLMLLEGERNIAKTIPSDPALDTIPCSHQIVVYSA